jgi:RNA polymerase sigma-70 factor (family 1)
MAGSIPFILFSYISLVLIFDPPMKEADEYDLVQRLRNGDQEAYIQLYDAYHLVAYGWVIRFVKIPELAEDIVQEVFMKIWEIRARLKPEQSFPAFIYRIARNKSFRVLKRAASNEKLRMQIVLRSAGMQELPDDHLLWQQYQQLFGDAVDRLPKQRQRVFTLCRIEGKTYEEAAAELGISRNTVKEHMVMAVKDIKEYCFRHGDIGLGLLLILVKP